MKPYILSDLFALSWELSPTSGMRRYKKNHCFINLKLLYELFADCYHTALSDDEIPVLPTINNHLSNEFKK